MSLASKPVLLLATTNRHKAKEITEILMPNLKATPLQYRTFHDYLKTPNIVETGTTFHENAVLKAVETAQFFATQGLEPHLWGVLSDDSGLVVPSLDGAPGVHSARYAALACTAQEQEYSKANRTKLLTALQTVTAPEKRRASFLTSLVFGYKTTPEATLKTLKKHHVIGRVDGWITHKERGNAGFGYDSIFVPKLDNPLAPSTHYTEQEQIASGRTFAEMSPAEKNSCSHRRNALIRFNVFFQELISQTSF